MNMTVKNHANTVRILALAAVLVALLLLPSLTRADLQHEAPRDASSAQSESATSRILHSDDAGISFELITPPLNIAEDGSLQVNGLGESIIDPGSPDLPYFSTFIALPPEASITVEVSESDLTRLSSLNVPPVPLVQLQGEEAVQGDDLVFAPGSITEQAPEYTKNQTIYGNDAPFPGDSYQLSDPMYLRDMRIVELKLFPVQYNPLQKRVTQALRMIVNIRFSDANFDDLHPESDYVESQEAAWRENVINYDQAREWRSLPQGMTDTQAVKLPLGTNTFKFEVDRDGIYEIAGTDLAAMGMSLPVNPATLQMMNDGKSVAHRFIDVNNNQQFDAADIIRFYGWAFDGSRQEKLFVAKNVYWLWAGGTASQVPSVNNQAGSGTTITSFEESITRQDELIFSSNWAIKWDQSPNDPTNWHWYLYESCRRRQRNLYI